MDENFKETLVYLSNTVHLRRLFYWQRELFPTSRAGGRWGGSGQGWGIPGVPPAPGRLQAGTGSPGCASSPALPATFPQALIFISLLCSALLCHSPAPSSPQTPLSFFLLFFFFFYFLSFFFPLSFFIFNRFRKYPPGQDTRERIISLILPRWIKVIK